MVEDRDKYYKEKHAAAHQALITALNSMGAAGALAPEQVNNIAALLAMEGVSSDVVLSMLLNPSQQQNFVPAAQLSQMPLTNQIGNFTSSAFLPPSPQQQQHQMQSSTRYSAPQLGHNPVLSSDFYLPSSYQGQGQATPLQQQHQQHGHHLPPAPSSGGGASGGSANSMRSASGPLPNSIGPFGSMMSREGSFSSLSTLSDWYSTTSSARTSLDLGGYWGGSAAAGGGGQPPARLSMDAALQLRQQLMAVAAATQGAQGPISSGQQNGLTGVGVGGNGGNSAASAQAQWLASQNLALHRSQQQQQVAPPAPAAVFQSAFYQSAAAPAPIINNNSTSVSSPLQTANSLPLPPIREGHPGPLDPYSAAVWASAQFGGSTLLAGGSTSGGFSNQTASAFLGGAPLVERSSGSPFTSGPTSPVRPSPQTINSDVTIQLRELSLSNNSQSSLRNDQDLLGLGVSSSRNPSDGSAITDGLTNWQSSSLDTFKEKAPEKI